MLSPQQNFAPVLSCHFVHYCYYCYLAHCWHWPMRQRMRLGLFVQVNFVECSFVAVVVVARIVGQRQLWLRQRPTNDCYDCYCLEWAKVGLMRLWRKVAKGIVDFGWWRQWQRPPFPVPTEAMIVDFVGTLVADLAAVVAVADGQHQRRPSVRRSKVGGQCW